MSPPGAGSAAPAAAKAPAGVRGLPHRHPDLLVTLGALALIVAWDASGLDLAVSRWFGTASGFPWKEHWLTRDLLHTGGRWLAFAALAAILVNLRWPLFAGQTRAERWLWLGLTLLCLLVVPGIKQLTLTSCPWSLVEFGGAAHQVSHWRFGVADGGSGHCFPSGHATSAFAFFSGYVVLRRAHPVAARRWLAGVLCFGLLFAWAQTARGAHYPSHSMWTAWACWTICIAGIALWNRRVALVRAGSPGH